MAGENEITNSNFEIRAGENEISKFGFVLCIGEILISKSEFEIPKLLLHLLLPVIQFAFDLLNPFEYYEWLKIPPEAFLYVQRFVSIFVGLRYILWLWVGIHRQRT
jgi:hypothetical protein